MKLIDLTRQMISITKKQFPIITYVVVMLLLGSLFYWKNGEITVRSFLIMAFLVGYTWMLLFYFETIGDFLSRLYYNVNHPYNKYIFDILRLFIAGFVCCNICRYYYQTVPLQKVEIIIFIYFTVELVLFLVWTMHNLVCLFDTKQRDFIYQFIIQLVQIIMYYTIGFSILLSYDKMAILGFAANNSFELYLELLYFSSMTLIGGNCTIIPNSLLAKMACGSETIIFVIGITIIIIGNLKQYQK